MNEVRTLDTAPLRETSPQKSEVLRYGTIMFSMDLTVLPAHSTPTRSIRNQNELYLPVRYARCNNLSRMD